MWGSDFTNHSIGLPWYLMTAGHLPWTQDLPFQCNTQSALLQPLLWLHMAILSLFSRTSPFLSPSTSSCIPGSFQEFMDIRGSFTSFIQVQLLCTIPRFTEIRMWPWISTQWLLLEICSWMCLKSTALPVLPISCCLLCRGSSHCPPGSDLTWAFLLLMEPCLQQCQFPRSWTELIWREIMDKKHRKKC